MNSQAPRDDRARGSLTGCPQVGNGDRRVEVRSLRLPGRRPRSRTDAVTAELLLHGRDAPGQRERPHRGGGSDRSTRRSPRGSRRAVASGASSTRAPKSTECLIRTGVGSAAAGARTRPGSAATAARGVLGSIGAHGRTSRSAPHRPPALLDEWLEWAARSRLTPFVKLGRTIRKHAEGILAYLDTKMTNGPVEGINNNKLRVIARRAYGFHSPAR